MQGRAYSSAAYRYGFNGKEKEADGTADNYDFGARIYDGRLGRWLAVDNFKHMYPAFSPYNFALNDVIRLLDEDGQFVKDNEGRIIFVSNANGSDIKTTTTITQPQSQNYDDTKKKIKQEIVNGQIVEKVVHEEFTELRYEAVEGYVFDDAGKKVPALYVEDATVTMVKVTRTWNEAKGDFDEVEETVASPEAKNFCSDLSATTNCTGSTFLDGKLVMFSQNITEKVLENENMKKLTKDEQPIAGDVGIYRDIESRVPEHFVTYVSPANVDSKGGVSNKKSNVPANSSEVWTQPPGSIYEIWRKTGAHRLVSTALGEVQATTGVRLLSKKEGKELKKQIRKLIKEENKT
jgi:RHS repeat-associated protein